MSGDTKNWRTDLDAQDYFGSQKKTLELADRRPVIRKPSDLGLGPGISESAIRITDFNNLLATYNGYYSSAAGATNAPNATEGFVGHVVMDTNLGGTQTFTGMGTGTGLGKTYTRRFTRKPSDTTSIMWDAWVSASSQIAMARAYNGSVATTVPMATSTLVTFPVPTVTGPAGVFTVNATNIRINKGGVYAGMATGYFSGGTVYAAYSQFTASLPNGTAQLAVTLSDSMGVTGDRTSVPFQFYVADSAAGSLTLSFQVFLAWTDANRTFYFNNLTLTRIGDA